MNRIFRFANFNDLSIYRSVALTFPVRSANSFISRERKSSSNRSPFFAAVRISSCRTKTITFRWIFSTENGFNRYSLLVVHIRRLVRPIVSVSLQRSLEILCRESPAWKCPNCTKLDVSDLKTFPNTKMSTEDENYWIFMMILRRSEKLLFFHLEIEKQKKEIRPKTLWLNRKQKRH